MKTVVRDTRYAFRILRRSPSFTITVVLTIALTVGASVSAFTVVNAVLLRPLPYPDAHQLVRIESPGNLTDIRERIRSFERVASAVSREWLITSGEEPEQLWGAVVSPALFPMLGVEPAYGRVFLPEEEYSRSEPNEVIISYGLWQRRFGADPGVIGTQLRVENLVSHTIVGVMPPRFEFPGRTEIWGPWLSRGRSAPDQLPHTEAFARLRKGVTADQARQELESLAREFQQEYGHGNDAVTVTLEPLMESIVGRFRPAFLALLGGVLCVLLIACANLANLMLAQSHARHCDFAVRAALGASRNRLLRHGLTESLLLAALGSGIGLALSVFVTGWITGKVPIDIPRLDQVSVDAHVLGFTVLASVLTALVSGSAPAWRLSRGDFRGSLLSANRAYAKHGRDSLRDVLIVSEVALALVLTIAAGLLTRGYINLLNVDPGFRSSNVLTLKVRLPVSKFPRPPWQRLAAFYRELFEEIEAVPGVQVAGGITDPPLGGDHTDASFSISSSPESAAQERQSTRKQLTAETHVVSHHYFETMRIPILQGRDFNNLDAQLKGRSEKPSVGVAIVNQAMARRFWPNEDPVGSYLITDFDWLVSSRRVVGVVGDVRSRDMREESRPQIYIPYDQLPGYRMALMVRVSSDPLAVAPSLRTRIRSIDDDLVISETSAMDDIVAHSVSRARLIMILLSGFGVFSLVLAGLGVYGLVAYTTAQRRREIAIRRALGADPTGIVSLVVRSALKPVLLGLALGMAGAFALGPIIHSLVFGVSPTDPLTMALAALCILAVSTLASFVPSHRASHGQPMETLRSE